MWQRHRRCHSATGMPRDIHVVEIKPSEIVGPRPEHIGAQRRLAAAARRLDEPTLAATEDDIGPPYLGIRYRLVLKHFRKHPFETDAFYSVNPVRDGKQSKNHRPPQSGASLSWLQWPLQEGSFLQCQTPQWPFSLTLPSEGSILTTAYV